MKKIALVAFSATALLALSACGGDATTEEPVVEETAVVEEAPIDAATDAVVDPAATDAATDAAVDPAATDAAATDAPAE
jgi:hypothetical protein